MNRCIKSIVKLNLGNHSGKKEQNSRLTDHGERKEGSRTRVRILASMKKKF